MIHNPKLLVTPPSSHAGSSKPATSTAARAARRDLAIDSGRAERSPAIRMEVKRAPRGAPNRSDLQNF